MTRIPFLKPKLPNAEEMLPYLRRIDQTRVYSNFGPLNTEFESRILAEHFDHSGAAVTVHNATLGLMLAIKAAMRPTGRLAVMPSFTFAATAQAALWCGLQPYFVDIRPDDFCVDETLLWSKVDELGDSIAVVVPYAVFGTWCNLAVYEKLHLSGVPVVVDAAASFGTRQDDRQYGAAFPGLMVFSFHATKAFGIGEGGLVYSSDADYIQRVRQSSNFGFTADRNCELLGLNGKLSEYGAAIELATLDRYPARITMRQHISDVYVEAMRRRNMFVRGWELQATSGRIAHQFMSVLCPVTSDRRRLILDLDRIGVQVRTYFSPPCHKQRLFADMPRAELPVTESISSRVLNLPMWDDMSDDDVEVVVEALSSS